MIACPRIGRRPRRSSRRRYHNNRRPFGTRGQKRNLDDPDRLQERRRPGQVWPRRQPRPTGRQPDRRQLHQHRAKPKRLELFSELVPHAGLIALLVNPNSSIAQRIIGNMQEAASAKGLQLDILMVSTESEIDAAFETLVQQHAGALVVGGDTFFANRLDQIIALAAHHAVPTIYIWRKYVADGGLIGSCAECAVA
jgi:ABC transporter substrate binding protein